MKQLYFYFKNSLIHSLVLIGIISIFSLNPLFASIYYIDFQAGSDNNSGLSQTHSWQHAPGDNNATGNANTTLLIPGDSLIFKGGIEYSGQINIVHSGSINAPIVYRGNTPDGNWGTGPALFNLNYTYYHAFYAVNINNITIDNVDVYRAKNSMGTAKALAGSCPAGQTKVNRNGIDMCVTYNGTTSPYDRGYIMVRGGDRWIIQNSRIHETENYTDLCVHTPEKDTDVSTDASVPADQVGINFYGVSNPVTNSVIDNVEIFATGRDAIDISRSSQIVVKNSNIGGFNQGSKSGYFAVAFRIGGNSSNITLSNNIIHDGWQYEGDDAVIRCHAGDWIHVYGNNNALLEPTKDPHDILIEKNFLYNDKLFTATHGTSNSFFEQDVYNVTWRNNVIVNPHHMGIQLETVDNFQIYNNTLVVYGPPTGGVSPIYVGSSKIHPQTMKIKNNIIVNKNLRTSMTPIYFATSSIMLDSDSNVFFSNPGIPVIYQGNAKYSLTEWQTFSGMDLHSSSLDPHLLGLPTDGSHSSSGNYHLGPLSTNSIAQGRNLSPLFSDDKDGVLRPSTGPWDMGAFKYKGKPPPNNTASLNITMPNVSYSPISSNYSVLSPNMGAYLAAKVTGGTGAVTVHYTVDGNPISSTLDQSPYLFIWKDPTVSESSHTLTAVAEDATGHVAISSATIMVQIISFGPVRTTLQPTGNFPAGTTQALLSLKTNMNATCKYGTVLNTPYASLPNTFSTTNDTSHSQLITGLHDGQSYTYAVRCQEPTGKANNVDYLLTFSVGVAPSNSLSDGLVAYWPFDEGTGSTINDVSGHGNNGTGTTGIKWKEGKVGSHSLQFNGVDDVISLPSNPALNLASTKTFSFWVDLFGLKTPSIVFDYGSSYVGFNHAGNLRFSGLFDANTTAPINTWEHYVIVFDVKGTGTNISVYKNGVFVSSKAVPLFNANPLLYLGAHGTTMSLGGVLDDFRIYDRVLTDNEITQLYNLGSANIVAPTLGQASESPPPIYYVDFDQGNNSNSGTSPSAAWKQAPGDLLATGIPASKVLQPGDTVLFKGGIVYQGRFTINQSGIEGKPITYDGNSNGTYGEGRAIIDGVQPLTGSNWISCSPGTCGNNINYSHLYTTKISIPTYLTQNNSNIPELNLNLFQGMKPVNPSQFPKSTSQYVQTLTNYYSPTSLTETSITDDRLNELGGASLVGSYIYLWADHNEIVARKIRTYDASTKTITFDSAVVIPLGSRTGIPSGTVYAIANNLSSTIFTQPGEYYLDPIADINGQNTLIVWPWDEEDLSKTNSISLSGTTLTVGNKIPEGDGIRIGDGQKYVTIQGFKIQRFGGGGIVKYSNGASSGIDHITLRNNEITLLYGTLLDNISLSYIGHVLIENNYIHDTRGTGRGISTFNGSGPITIRNNILNNVAKTGINVYTSNTEIIGNTVTGGDGTHGNGITTYGFPSIENVLVAGNTVDYGAVYSYTFDNITNVTITNNVFSGLGIACWGANGSCDQVTMTNNTIDGAFPTINNATHLTMKNNILIGQPTVGFPVTDNLVTDGDNGTCTQAGCTLSAIDRTTLFSHTPRTISSVGGTKYMPSTTDQTMLYVNRPVYSAIKRGDILILEDDPSPRTVTDIAYGSFATNLRTRVTFTPVANLRESERVEFWPAETTLFSTDFHLSSGSVAIASGMNLNTILGPSKILFPDYNFSTDIEGRFRPESTAWDFGAFQYSNLPDQNNPPTISIEAHQPFLVSETIQLRGTVIDDGNPVGGTLSSNWSVISGVGSVNFGNVTSPQTTATFSQPGNYVLRLTATDGILSAFAETNLTIIPLSNSGGNSISVDNSIQTQFSLTKTIFNLKTDPTFEIKFTLPVSVHVEISIYDRRGNEVKKWLNEDLSAGSDQSITWDGKNGSDNIIPSGVYKLIIKAGDHVETKKFVVVK